MTSWCTRIVRIAGCLLVLASGACGPKGSGKPAPDLVQDLKDPNEAVRIVAARDLGGVGPGQAAEAVKALTEALKDSSAYVRQAAVRSLATHGARAKDAVPALQKALKDADEGVRLEANHALKKIQGS